MSGCRSCSGRMFHSVPLLCLLPARPGFLTESPKQRAFLVDGNCTLRMFVTLRELQIRTPSYDAERLLVTIRHLLLLVYRRRNNQRVVSTATSALRQSTSRNLRGQPVGCSDSVTRRVGPGPVCLVRPLCTIDLTGQAVYQPLVEIRAARASR